MAARSPSEDPDRRLDFADHRRDLGRNRYVYAVVSRRSRGLSIGINLNPDKVCNFDCPYCQVDRTVPGGDGSVLPDVVEAELDHLLSLVASGALWQRSPFDTAAPEFRRVNDIAVAGDGEPTSCPQLGDVVDLIGRVRERHGLAGPGPEAVDLYLLTNATLFHRPSVAAALARWHALGGKVWAKLDAGTAAGFSRAAATAHRFDRVLENITVLARRQPLTLQCLFFRDSGRAPLPAEGAAWAQRIAEILAAGGQIEEVQVYTTARKPADPAVEPLTRAELDAIAAHARSPGLVVRVIA